MRQLQTAKYIEVWQLEKRINELFSQKKKPSSIGPFSFIQVVIFKTCPSQLREYITE